MVPGWSLLSEGNASCPLMLSRSSQPHVHHEEDHFAIALPRSPFPRISICGIVSLVVHAPTKGGESDGNLWSDAPLGVQQHADFQCAASASGKFLSATFRIAKRGATPIRRIHRGTGRIGGRRPEGSYHQSYLP